MIISVEVEKTLQENNAQQIRNRTEILQGDKEHLSKNPQLKSYSMVQN